MSVVMLYLLLLKATVLSFSGYASVPVVREDLVVNRGVLTDEQLNDAIAISQTSPGPLGLYVVIAGYLVAITAFGSLFAKFQKTTNDYFLASRTSPWWAICFTIVATETSTLSFIGVPAQAYGGGMGFLQLAAGYIVGRIIVSLVFIPAYFRGELVTSYELLQRRFGPAVKTAASAIFLITRSLADGIRLFATAIVACRPVSHACWMS